MLDRRSEGPPPRDRSRLARHRSALENIGTPDRGAVRCTLSIGRATRRYPGQCYTRTLLVRSFTFCRPVEAIRCSVAMTLLLSVCIGCLSESSSEVFSFFACRLREARNSLVDDITLKLFSLGAVSAAPEPLCGAERRRRHDHGGGAPDPRVRRRGAPQPTQ